MTTAIIKPNAVPAPSAQMLRSGRSAGITAVEFYEVLEQYPEEQRETLAYWFEYNQENNCGLTELGRRTGASSTTLTRLFRGIYEGDVAGQIEKLAIARINQVEVIGNPDFITTSLARKMFAVFDKTRALRNVTIMWGPMGIGKSTVIREYQRAHNHGRTFAVRCQGHGMTACQFFNHVADSMHIATKGKNSAKARQEITRMLSKGSRLLIVDELHEIFRTCTPLTIIRICEWLRETQEVADCGLALTGTELLHTEFFSGIHRDVLAQLVDRGTVQIPLGAKPTKQDILAFMSHYGLSHPATSDPEADKLVNDIISANGLRKLTLHLRDGAAYANKRGDAYAWHHFTAAFKDIESLKK